MSEDSTQSGQHGQKEPIDILSSGGREVWEQIVTRLGDYADPLLVAAYCEAASTFARASWLIEQADVLVVVDGQTAPNPALQVRADAARQMRELGPIIGLGPPPTKEPRQCVAHSSRTGEPCRKIAIKGGTVCERHGGSAPHVRAAAMRRLLQATDSVSAEMVRLALSSSDQMVRVRAAKDVLDRCGLAPPSKLEVETTVHNGDSDLDRDIARLLKQFGVDGLGPMEQGTPSVAADRTP